MGLLTERAQFDQNEENYGNIFFSCHNNHIYNLKQGKAYSVPYKGNSILVASKLEQLGAKNTRAQLAANS